MAALEADAFGSPLAASESPSRYTGKPYDTDMGAFVFPFRNYRADEGRWMTADPSGFPDGINANRYMPALFVEIDPLGLAIIHINNASAVSGFGHSGIIIGSGSTWTYNSFGNGSGSSSSGTNSTLTSLNFTSQQAALNHAANLGYTQGLSYNTTASQDAAAQAQINTWQGSTYHPVDHNCVGMVNDALDAAGVNHSNLTGPNLNFNESRDMGGARFIEVRATE